MERRSFMAVIMGALGFSAVKAVAGDSKSLTISGGSESKTRELQSKGRGLREQPAFISIDTTILGVQTKYLDIVPGVHELIIGGKLVEVYVPTRRSSPKPSLQISYKTREKEVESISLPSFRPEKTLDNTFRVFTPEGERGLDVPCLGNETQGSSRLHAENCIRAALEGSLKADPRDIYCLVCNRRGEEDISVVVMPVPSENL